MIAFWLTSPGWYAPTAIAALVVLFPHRRLRDWWWARRVLRAHHRDIQKLPSTCERDRHAA